MEFFHPTLSTATQALIRCIYGVLLLGTLVQALPQARRFFVSERWGGYAKSNRRVDLVQNPYALPFVMGAWLACAVLLITGRWTALASFVNLLLCRYFFIAMRWKGILRGIGAPGFMTYWLAACVFFLEYASAYDRSGTVRSAAIFAFRLDFAVIMLCAGTYKSLAGYAQNDGMELGMVNPWWGYWGHLYGRIRPSYWLFRVLNHLAYGTEIVAGLLMLIPATQLLGAFLILGSFAFIALHIRLGFLAEMVMLCAFLFIPEGHWVDRLIVSFAPAAPGVGAGTFPWVNGTLTASLYAYSALLLLAKAGQYYNFLARRTLPGPLQKLLDGYTNFFGIIIWRVFSVDHTNFWARIWFQDRESGRRSVAAHFGSLRAAWGFRYAHVGEFICLTSLFTTLKYYPSNSALFVERLVRYSRTLDAPPRSDIVFEYMSVRKECDRFESVPVAEYTVDLETEQVAERVLDSSVSVRGASPVSPMHAGIKPGSYAPAG